MDVCQIQRYKSERLNIFASIRLSIDFTFEAPERINRDFTRCLQRSPWGEAINTHIEANLQDELTVDDVARAVFVSPAHICVH